MANIHNPNILDMQASKSPRLKAVDEGNILGRMEKPKKLIRKTPNPYIHPDRENSPLAKRMQKLREVMVIEWEAELGGDRSAAAFARRIGVTAKRWNNCERGHPVGRDMENLLLTSIPGLSRDWIMDDVRDNLSAKMDRLLNTLGTRR